MPADDETKFLGLYEAHHRRIYAYLKRRTDLNSAQECAADTFLVAWRRISDIPEGKELQWLYGVARRVLSNRRRASRRAKRLLDKMAAFGSSTDPTPETIVVRRQEDEALMAAVGKLRAQDRELLRLATWEEMPHREIAQILGCSSHAVDQRLHRATRRLARELAGSGHQPGDKPTLRSTPQGDTK